LLQRKQPPAAAAGLSASCRRSAYFHGSAYFAAFSERGPGPRSNETLRPPSPLTAFLASGSTVVISLSYTDWWPNICFRPHLLLRITNGSTTVTLPSWTHLTVAQATIPSLQRRPLPSGTLQVPPLASPAMATAASSGGHQYVSVKLESPRLAALDLAPHLFGSHPVAGSWDLSKAVSIESPQVRMYVSGPGIDGYSLGDVRSCRWSGRRMPFGSSAVSSLLTTVSCLTFSCCLMTRLLVY
jgi:hypothetical protein